MVKFDPRSAFAAFALMSLIGCSSGDDALYSQPEGQEREFSEEDKRIARVLSISQDSAVTEADSPYARALLCRNGIDTLAEHFQNAGGFSEQQRQGIRQAQVYFDSQLRILGADEGKSPGDIDGDLDQIAAERFDPAQDARVAIACLQRLRQETD